ncbi:MAG: alpha/beta hydrolase [Erysipelotrichaceae bacterium]|nr:alpha/beta hydrolase [Erysipelotrichaceae bacterium]MDY5252813.1 alpha/beta hydrolase [Erysipelotrichaceae bacterium]
MQHKYKKIGIICMLVILMIFSCLLFGANYLVNYALKVENGYIAASGENPYDGWSDTEAQRTYDEWIKDKTVEEIYIESYDGLTLYAESLKVQDSHNYLLAVHGYTVDHRDIAPYTVPFFEKGYNVITIDQRARENSEGNHVTMGYKESFDVLSWINYIISIDEKAQIVLYGESMGAATVMLAASKDVPKNVKAVIEDCGYTSAKAMYKDQLKERFNLPDFPLLNLASIISRIRYQFDFDEANVLKHINDIKVPVLFIHGSADDYVPTYMVKELYDAYKNEKELLIIDGAGHGASADIDPNLYYETIFLFLEGIIR